MSLVILPSPDARKENSDGVYCKFMLLRGRTVSERRKENSMQVLSTRIWINRWGPWSCTVCLHAILSCYITMLQHELEHADQSCTSQCKKNFLASVRGGLEKYI